MSEHVRVFALPKLLDPSDRIEVKVPPGSSIDDMIALSLPAMVSPDRELLRVHIDDWIIEPEYWHRVRPKIGTCVMIRVVPGNNQVLRNVLTIAATVAAVALATFIVGPQIAAAIGTGATATFLTGVVTTGLVIASTLLINALVPLRQPKKSAADSPTYTVQGWRNVANPDGVVPLVLGRHRMAPPYAALPFTIAIGDVVYVYAAFCFGYGPLSITNERIGDLTRIEAYRGVTKELRNGYPGDAPLTIINQQTIEVPLSVNLLNGVQNYRYTARDAAAFSVDLAFPQGLVSYDNRGNPRLYGVNFIISIRKVGTSTWTVVGTPGYSDFRAKAKIATFGPVPLPDRGTYEVEVRRNTVDDALVQAANGIQTQSRSDWVAIRSYRPEYPIHFNKPLALSAVVVQATDQLNGTLDSYNADVCSICPDWDVPTQTWIARETNNPASLFRYVLTGPGISYPLGLDELYGLEDWHEFCASKGLTYNRIHDYEASILDVLSDIAAAGRASPHDNGTAWGVVIDRIIDTVTAHISPRNSWAFQGERAFPVMPDAFRVSFRDETNFYNPMERIVRRPDLGVGDEILVTESIDLPGVTHPDLVWKEARRRWYELFNRPDTYTASQDFEAIVVSRGDKVMLSHDVLDRLQVAARVKTIADQLVMLDEEVTMDGALSYACRFRLADGASVLRSVATHAGITTAITLTGTGAMPAAGDLAFFGIAGREAFEAIVKGIETTDHLTARLTLVDAAPQIQTLTDAEVPPAWDGRAGGEISIGPSAAPLTPIISVILSGASAGGTDAVPPVEVFLTAASGSPPIADYEVDHRLVGGSFITVAGAPHSSTVTINGYSPGDVIELRARAVNSAGASPYTAIVTFYVATYRFDRTDVTWDSADITWDAA